MLIPIIGKIWNGMTMLLEPIIESVTKTFGGMGDTLSAVDNILNWVFDTLNGVVRGGILIFESLMRGIDTLSGPFKRLGDTIFGVEESTGSFGDTLIDIGAAVGTALELLADVIGWTIDNAVIPLVKMFQDYVLPVLDSVYQTIKEYLVPILVAAGVLFLAFNAMTILGTVVKFAYIAAMVIATAGLAILAAGFAIAAAAVALFTSPIGIAILVIGSLIAIFKKFGGDIEVAGNAFKWIGSAMNGLWLSLKGGIFGLLNMIPGMRGDFDKDLEKIAEEEKANVKEKERLETAMSTKMAENVAKREAEKKAEAAGEGKQTSGLMDDLKGLFGPKGAAQAAAAERHKDEKRAQNINFRNNRPGKFGGGGAGGAGAAGAKDPKDPKAAEGKPEIQMDYNASSESMLKQLAEKEGSALAVKPGAASPDMAKSIEALKAANAMKGGMEADAQKKKQEEEAKKKTEDEKKKVEEDAKKKKEEEEKNKKPESAETLLAQLNTSMTRLLAHAEQTTKNTYATYDATKGLNKNLYKA
jgi:colicin import membrane protein